MRSWVLRKLFLHYKTMVTPEFLEVLKTVAEKLNTAGVPLALIASTNLAL